MDRGKARGLCLLITINIRDAFNLAPCAHIHDAVKRCYISIHLRNFLKSYLKDRVVTYDGLKHNMTCGVPQGSVRRKTRTASLPQ